MKIETVTVCVGHHDFLAATALENAGLFDRWTVVTSPSDRDTLGVCRDFSLHSVVTDDFARGGEFNKGRGVQRGLNSLACDGWVLHLDSDVVLPRTFRTQLESAHLDEAGIYGCDRMMVRSWEDWQTARRGGLKQSGRHCYVHPDDRYPIGTRWCSPADGYVPIGFFQLWHGTASIRDGYHSRPYPDHHSDAARSDVQFALQWDRRNRHLLPEVFVWHLESERARVGANWRGRTTKPFGPASHASIPKPT